MEEDGPMQRMKDSYNRVEGEREMPKLKLYSLMVMRYLAIAPGRCSNHQYSCKNFNMVVYATFKILINSSGIFG